MFIYLDPTILKPFYTALVWPCLEYVKWIWCPYLVKDVEARENVQRRQTKLVLSGLNYEERLRKLDLPTLAYSRPRGEQIEAYKIISYKYDLDCTKEIFKMKEYTMTRGNPMKILMKGSQLNTRK